MRGKHKMAPSHGNVAHHVSGRAPKHGGGFGHAPGHKAGNKLQPGASRTDGLKRSPGSLGEVGMKESQQVGTRKPKYARGQGPKDHKKIIHQPINKRQRGQKAPGTDVAGSDGIHNNLKGLHF